MTKKALIFDLDDTIYPARSVAEDIYAELFALIGREVNEEVLDHIREDLLTTAFHTVADRYALDKELKCAGLTLCLDLDYHGTMKTFDDYQLALNNTAVKFLVTAGYTRLQKSKIRQLGIEKDFKEIIIADPYTSDLSKADVFKQLMDKYQYAPGDVLVIGDNPDAEIAAGKSLGTETYLYDYQEKYSPALADHYGTSYSNFDAILR